MPAHEIRITLPELRWEEVGPGKYRFEAGDEERGFEATLDGRILSAFYHLDGDGSRGTYIVETRDELATALGGLLVLVAGAPPLPDIAEACVRDGQLPLPEPAGKEDR